MPAGVTLKSRIPEIAASLEPRAELGIRAAAEKIEHDAKERAPVGSPPEDPHPGRLRESIKAEKIDGEWWVLAPARAGTEEQGAPYGHMVEFGTVDTAPQPFLIPAAEDNRVSVAVFVAGALRTL